MRLSNVFTVRLSGKRWFPLWALVIHRGRKSGRTLSTPVAARRTRNGFVIALPWGAKAHWCQNLIAAGGGIVRWKASDYRVRDPRIVGMSDVADAFSPIQRALLRLASPKQFLVLTDA